MQRRAARFGLAFAVAAALDIGGSGADAAPPGAPSGERSSISEGQAACGKPGAPPCPLQKWMRANVAGPLSANEMAALAVGLEKTAKLAPDPAWTTWATLAMSGAAAAKRGDIAGARASCKGCHDAWRDAYREKYRLRPIPR
jgi:hypothetical protein